MPTSTEESEEAEAGLGPRRSQARTAKGRFADGTLKVVADMSAEERSYARSRKIRKKLRSWMDQNAGQEWATLSELYRDAANYAGCAIVTAGRWIYQYTGPGQPWETIELEDAYRLVLRGGKR